MRGFFPTATRLTRFLRFGAPAALLAAPALTRAQTQETFPPDTQWLPPPVSTYAHEIDLLFYIILWMTTIVGIGVFGFLIYFLIKYRYKPGRVARFTHGNAKLELVWTLIPTAILALTAAVSQGTWIRLKHPDRLPTGDDVVTVRVIGRQFAWYAWYPGADGQFGQRKDSAIPDGATQPDELIGLIRNEQGKDDIVAEVMYVPVDTEVVVEITSVDVIHSFYLPNFRVKQDAVPGLTTTSWFESTMTSEQFVGVDQFGNAKPFDIVCAELCGQGHFKMRGQMFVVNRDRYEQFLKERAADLGGDGFGF